MWGSVLRWRLAFPHAGFAPAGEYELCSARPLYPSRLAIKIERALDKKKTVDVRILNGSTLRFRSQVLRFGKLLHSKDEKKRIEFETSSLLQYYDFKPHLEMYDAARRVRLGI